MTTLLRYNWHMKRFNLELFADFSVLQFNCCPHSTWTGCLGRLWNPGSPCGSLFCVCGPVRSLRLSRPRSARPCWPVLTCWASWPSGSRRGCFPWMVRYPGGVKRSWSCDTFTILTPIPIRNMFECFQESSGRCVRPFWPLWLACSALCAAQWRCRCTLCTHRSSTWWSCPLWSQKAPRWTL